MQLLNRDGHSISHNSKRHYHDSFVSMNRMRQRGLLCDIVLHVSNKEIKAHKVVLASCSPYFHAMFTSKFSLSLLSFVLLSLKPMPARHVSCLRHIKLVASFGYVAQSLIAQQCVQCSKGHLILLASRLPSPFSCLGHRWSVEVCVSFTFPLITRVV